MKTKKPNITPIRSGNHDSLSLKAAMIYGLRLLAVTAVAIPLSLKATPIPASLYWDTAPGTPGLGGSGGWNTTTGLNWNVNSNGAAVSGAAWQQNVSSPFVSAVFDGTPGIVTIDGNATVNVKNMTFNVDGYSIQRQPFNNNDSITVDPNGSVITVSNASDRAIIEPGLIGSGAVTISGPGIVQFYRFAKNTYTGGTFVNDGTLELNKISNTINLAIPGNITIGDGIGAADSAVVRNLHIAQISDGNNYTMTVNRDGLYDVNGQGEIIDKLILNNGHVKTGSASFFEVKQGSQNYALEMHGGLIEGTAPLLINGNNVWATSADTAVITAPVDLMGNTVNFNVVQGDESVDLQVSGLVSNGGITKTGNGVMVLDYNGSATSWYTGDTTVNGGTLVINAGNNSDPNPFNSRISVNNDAELAGTGVTAKGVHIYEAGRFFAGSGADYNDGTPGTFQINSFHNFTMESNIATFSAGIGGFANSQLLLSNGNGDAYLNNSLLSVSRFDGYTPNNGASFVIIDANNANSGHGVHGVFSNTFVKTDGQYGLVGNGDGIYLNNTSSGTGSGPNGNGFWDSLPVLAKVDYSSNQTEIIFVADFVDFFHGLTPNQHAVAAALDNHVMDENSKVQSTINFILQDNVNHMPTDFDLIAPEEFTAMFQIGISGATVQNANILGRLADLRLAGPITEPTPVHDGKTTVSPKDGKHFVAPEPAPDHKWEFFVAGSGEFTDVSGDGNGSGYNFTTAGVTVGGSYKLGEHLALGVFGGYANTDASLINDGSIDTNSGFGGLFGTWFDKGFYVDSIVSGGYTSYDTSRTGLPSPSNREQNGASGNSRASGDTDGDSFSALIGGGYDLHKGGLTFGPLATLQYTYVEINSFTESGSLDPLSINSQSEDSLISNVGAHASYEFQVGGMTVRPQVRVTWQHEYLNQALSISSQIAGTGVGFTTNGPKIGSDSVIVGAGVAVDINSTWTVYTTYQGDLGRTNYEQQSVFGGVVVKF